MTRAPKDTAKPLRRLVSTLHGDLVVEMYERRVVFRLPRARTPLVDTTWGVLIQRALGERGPR